MRSEIERKKKPKILKLIMSIIFPLLIGSIPILLIPNMQSIYESLKKPFFAPPAYVFPIVWTILYILMGIASYMVYIKKYDDVDIDVSSALFVYVIQLLLNLFWTFIFFGFRLYGLAFLELVILFLFVILTSVRFYKKAVLKPFLLLVPYILWLVYAGVLNFFIWMLNEM
ncbi:putative transmembrane signaling protein, TspO/MBR family [Clostridium neonatale]|uniref:TspO/MBR family protein n=1 Tax=Clostridium neonatale TaxID=137838 RepID=UPI00291B6AF3|nr:TspO/MBR family protein [Clostridium neonatale]CAI3672520.1 putative transmembrane signaling protein, TspO/MBR family [Clostridium neonatale]